MNVVALGGNATRDPETKEFDSGHSVTNFGLAVNERQKQGDDWVEVPMFFDINVWDNYGKLIESKLRKGDQCFVTGRLQYRTWEEDGGKKREKISVTANKIEGEFQYRKKDEAPPTPKPEGDNQPKTPPMMDDDIPF
jgi:single-strand DNA-binding protein